MKYCCKICGRLNSAENWLDGHLKCSNCGQMVKSIDNAVCIGHFVAERYELKKLLEQRTNTNIYIAFDLFKQCPVLLRLYFWDFTYSVTSSEEFLEIAQSVSHLAQPEHLKIINCGRTLDGMLYTVWPYENLESVTRLLHLNGPIEPGVALSICRDIAVCLDTAYQTTGLGHYNLNTNKIYLTSDGQVRLSDLGHAAILLKDEHFINDENEYFNERFLGPEVTLDEEAPSFQSDMFSLGACLYFMLTGKKPFENLEYVCIDDYYDLKLSKSHEFRLGEKTLALLYRLLAVNPQSRFESWFEVIKESNHCLSLLDGQSTNSRKTRLTTKFDDDFLTDFQEEEYEEAKPQLLNASALSAALNTHKPAVKAHKISTKSNSFIINLSIAAILSFALSFLYFLITEGQPPEDELVAKTSPKSSISKNSTSTVSIRDDKNLNSLNPKEKFVVEVNTQQLQKMKVKERVITPRQEFQEFKFQVRELSLRKSWNEALALINSYYGPFALESLALKAEIERRRTSALSPPKELISENNKKSLFEKLLTVKPTMASHSPQIRDNRKSLKIKEAINLIVKLKLKKAQEHIIQIEKELEVNLNFFEIILDKIDSPSLTKNIVNGYKTDFGQQLKLQLKQSTIKGMLLFLDSQSGELTLVVNNQNTIIHVHDIHYKENFKRINDADPEQEALLKTLYLLQNKDTQLARKVIQDEYQGPMKSHFEKVLKSLQQ